MRKKSGGKNTFFYAIFELLETNFERPKREEKPFIIKLRRGTARDTDR